MQTISDIRCLLEERGLHPRHRLGQNFLHDQNQVRKLVSAAAITPGDHVLEIGPGTGILTEHLLEIGAVVTCCELDEGLADLIHDRLGDRVTLIRGDCLGRGRRLHEAVDERMRARDWKLVANLPYQAASPLMIELLLHHPRCRSQHVTIQREVADRLEAESSSRQRGPLGIIASTFASISRIGDVPAACFWPRPQVTSSMVSLILRPDPPAVDRDAFARFVTTLFSSRRKQLGGIFGRGQTLPEDIDPTWRPEVLSNGQLLRLFAMRGADR